MARRQNSNNYYMVPYSWDIRIDYPGGVKGTTSVPPVDQGKMRIPKDAAKFMDSVEAFDKKEYFFDFDDNAPLANEYWLGNLYNVAHQVLTSAKVITKFDSVLRRLKSQPLPVGAKGWRFEVTVKCEPIPPSTPDGWGWYFVASKSTAPDLQSKINAAWVLRQNDLVK